MMRARATVHIELAGGTPRELLLSPGTLFADLRSEWDTEQFPQMAQ